MDGWKTTFLYFRLLRPIFSGKLLVLGSVVWMIPETRSVTVVQTTIGEDNLYARERNNLKFESLGIVVGLVPHPQFVCHLFL